MYHINQDDIHRNALCTYQNKTTLTNTIKMFVKLIYSIKIKFRMYNALYTAQNKTALTNIIKMLVNIKQTLVVALKPRLYTHQKCTVFFPKLNSINYCCIINMFVNLKKLKL